MAITTYSGLSQPTSGTANLHELVSADNAILDLGWREKLTLASNFTAGQVCYVDGSGEAELADKGAEASSYAVGLCISDGNAGSDRYFQTHGIIEVSGWGLTPGAVYYLDTSGDITSSRPGTGYVVELGVARTTEIMTVRIKAYFTTVTGGLHNTLGNLAWSVAGHTMDTTLAMATNSITGVNDIQVTSISERIGSAGVTVSDPMTVSEMLTVTGNSDSAIPELRIVDEDTTVGSASPSMTFYSEAVRLWTFRGTDTDGFQFRNSSDSIVFKVFDSGAVQTYNFIAFTQLDGAERIDSSADNILDLYAGTTIKMHGITAVDHIAELTGSHKITLDDILLATDAIYLTQTDGNEYIDSLADGYVDIGATTGIRLNGETEVDGDITITDATPRIYFMENDVANNNWRIMNSNGSLLFAEVDDAKAFVGTRLTIDPSGHFIFATGSNASFGGVVYVDHIAELTGSHGITLDDSLYAMTNISVGTASPSASFRGTGDIYATSGIKAMEGLYSEAVPYGAGLEVQDNALAITYTNVAHGDATLTAATRLITDSHASFDSTYINKFFKVISSDPSFTGATGRIIGVPSSTTLVLSFGTSGDDVIVNATGMSFVIYPEPNFFVGDNGDISALIGKNESAHFSIDSPYGNGVCGVSVNATAGINDHTALCLSIDADDKGGVSAYSFNYDATGFVDGINGQGIDAIIDNAGTAGGHFHAMDVAISDPTNTDMGIACIGANPGVDVIHQHLGDVAALAAGFKGDASGSPDYTDTTTAFNSSGTNVQIFDADDDFILVASASTFDQINVLLSIEASRSVRPTFHYITDAGAWVEFTPSDDTNGFRRNGTVRFNSDDLTTWGQRTVAEVTGESGDTDYYWVKITRTRNNVPTPPTESTIQVTATSAFHEWDREGRLAIKTFNQAGEPDTDDLPAGKFCFWTDTDNSKLYICYNHGGTIKTTELT